jgi:DNA-directed RNA polymerase specialized sigma24 family protein
MCAEIQRSKTEQDAILLELYVLAERHAKQWVGSQTRDDVVQELALGWLRALRRGRWTAPTEGLDRYVERRIIGRRIERLRSGARDARRDAHYLAAIIGTSCDLIAPGHGLDEAQLERFVRRIRRKLPALWVRAHKLVRVERLTYAEAARKLCTTPKCVHNYVTAVQNAFRNALPEIGIEPQAATRGGSRAEPAVTADRSIKQTAA